MQRSPRSARRQRKALYESSTQERRRRMTVPLSRELKSRFHRRSLPIRKGDTVRILGGSYVGREERVAKVNRRSFSVTLDNVTSKTGESKQTPLPIRTGHLVLIRLNLADPYRRRILRVSEAELTPEERGETPEAPAATETGEAAPAAPATTEDAPKPEDGIESLDDLDEDDEDEEEDDDLDEEDDLPAPPKEGTEP